MIKNIFFVLVVIVLSSCKENNEYTIKYVSSKPFLNNSIGIEAIFFETDFDKDSAEVILKDEIIFKEIITTNHRIGLAKFFHFDNKLLEHLSISINQNKFKLKNITGKYAIIKFYNDTVFINYKDKVYGYK